MRYGIWNGLSWTVLWFTVLTGCGDLELDVMGDKIADQGIPSPDDEAEKMIRSNEVAEARAWLADENDHVLWKGDRGKINQLVERLYAAGVLKVYAAGISKDGPKEIVAEFMAELPNDATARTKIFQVQAEFWKSYIDEPTKEDLEQLTEKDTGQKYLMFNFDL